MSYYVIFSDRMVKHTTWDFAETYLYHVSRLPGNKYKRAFAFSTEPHEKHLERHYINVFPVVPRWLKKAVTNEKTERKKSGKRLKDFRVLGFEPMCGVSLISLNIVALKKVSRLRITAEDERRERFKYMRDVYDALSEADMY